MGKIKELQARGVSDLMSYDLGRQDERERIIKLLEQLIPEKPTYEMPMEYWVQRKLIEQAITLIKGGTE